MPPLRFVLLGAITLVGPTAARAQCSTAALEAVNAEARAATVPDCGTRPLRHAFKRARKKTEKVTARAVTRCEIAGTVRIAAAHRVLLKVVAEAGRASANGTVPPACAVLYEAQLLQLDTDLTAAANGTATTTTTSPPGTPTTTTEAPCTMIMLEVDKGDCTGVTSDPPGLVECGDGCDVKTFVVPAVGSLRLKGAPAEGDTETSFDTDCDDDGTVPFEDASMPDCELSCDCSSDF